MTTAPVTPESLHACAIYLQASEEARRRGDRRTGTDHILLALFEDPEPAWVSWRLPYLDFSGRLGLI